MNRPLRTHGGISNPNRKSVTVTPEERLVNNIPAVTGELLGLRYWKGWELNTEKVKNRE